MSAQLPDPHHPSCLTPAVERVLAWHRQRRAFSLPTLDEAVPSEPPLQADLDAPPVWGQADAPTSERGQPAEPPGAAPS